MIIPLVYSATERNGFVFSHQFHWEFEKAVTEKKHLFLGISGDTYQEFDYDTLFGKGPRLLIVYSSQLHWLFPALTFFQEKNIDVLLLGDSPDPSLRVRCCISQDLENDMTLLLDHLSDCGCTKPALYNIFEDSAADCTKRHLFIDQLLKRGIANPESACIINHSGLRQCYQDFISRISEFDSVICTNSLAAISLINHLRRNGIRIPEDIQIVTFGKLQIAQLFKTSITAIIPQAEDTSPKNIIQIYRYLYTNHNSNEHLKIVNTNKLEIGETTAPLKNACSPSLQKDSLSKLARPDFYNDEEVIAFSKLEQLFSLCDDIDIKLLHCMLKGYSYEKMADKIHISTGTVFYRLQRLIQNSRFDTRASLEEFLRIHDFDNIFS